MIYWVNNLKNNNPNHDRHERTSQRIGDITQKW